MNESSRGATDSPADPISESLDASIKSLTAANELNRLRANLAEAALSVAQGKLREIACLMNEIIARQPIVADSPLHKIYQILNRPNDL